MTRFLLMVAVLISFFYLVVFQDEYLQFIALCFVVLTLDRLGRD